MSEIELVNDVGVLKGKVDSLTSVANKLDIIIEKLVDLHDRHVTKIYDDMENRRMETQEQIKEIHDRIDTVLDKVSDTEKSVSEKIEKLQKCIMEHNQKEREQLDQILKWKWTVAGGIIVLAWLLSHVTPDTIIQSFH